MEELPPDMIEHIGKFLPFTERRTCILTCKLFRSINFSYKFQNWRQLMSNKKINTLLKYKPLVNHIKIDSDFNEYSSSDDLTTDLINICEKKIKIELKLDANNPYFSSILLNKSIILMDTQVVVNNAEELNLLYDILLSRDDLYLHSLTIRAYSKESLLKISTIADRIKHCLDIYESNIFLDGINLEGLKCIPIVNLINSFLDCPEIIMEATHLSLRSTLMNNIITSNFLDMLSNSKRLQILMIDYIDVAHFLIYDVLFEKLKQVIDKTNCCLLFKNRALLDTNIIILIKMFLEIYKNKNIYLQDSSIYKTIYIIKKYFISDSRVILWEDKNFNCSASYSELLASIPNKNLRNAWNIIL